MLERTLDILGRLVACPTVSTHSNLDLVDYAVDLLEAAGAAIHTSFDSTGKKANVFATIGPDEGGGVVLSGHTDVVPTEGQDWSRDPFSLAVESGRAYGRGTTDMKGFIAAVLAMAPTFAAAGRSRPVHIALTYDEEEGCHGARTMLFELARGERPMPSTAIIGEPTGFEVVIAHKGCYEYTTEIIGVERHASMSAGGAGAIHAAARFITFLDSLATEMAARSPADSPFDPPQTTINVGTISGGVARNITAGSAVFDWEIRPVVAADASYIHERLDRFVDHELLPSMRAAFPDAAVTTTVAGEIGGFWKDPNSPAVELARRLTGNHEPTVVSFGTEAGLYQEVGIAPVVCGPGDIDQAHKPDEFIELSQLERCLTVLERLIEEL